jgi:beta-N-acetylhexosaminidase
MINRRRLISGAVALTAAGRVTRSGMATTPRSSSLTSDVSEMLMFGFAGNTIEAPSARLLAGHIAAGRVGAVVFVKENVGSREDALELVRLFSTGSTPLIAIDHEGGFVQRLRKRQGFTSIPSARSVGARFSVGEARSLYAKAAVELSAIGFNVNLAPVVDLDDPASPAIGHFERAFHSDPVTVAAYAQAFIDGFGLANIHCVLKHFPGEGHSRSDSHYSLSDISQTWSEEELEPYARMIASGRARIIMSGHLHLATIEKDPIPITLSSAAITGMLRGKLGFWGVVMTDDLDMVAVSSLMGRREAVIRAIAAGNDLLMIRNSAKSDPHLPQKISEWVQDAIHEGILSKNRIAESAERVREVKRALSHQAIRRLQSD